MRQGIAFMLMLLFASGADGIMESYGEIGFIVSGAMVMLLAAVLILKERR